MNQPATETPTKPERFFSWKRIVFWLLSLVVIMCLIVMLLPATRNARPAARRAKCQNNLKQILYALQSYVDAHGESPPLYTVDESGRPLHGWRTLLLPYLDQQHVYNQIDLTKPWNDPVHDQVRRTTISLYACPSVKLKPGQTTYLANAAYWPAKLWTNSSDTNEENGSSEFLAASNIIVFEVDESQAVEWMSPTDGNYETFLANLEKGKLPHETMIQVLITGGHIEAIRPDLNPGTDNDSLPKLDP